MINQDSDVSDVIAGLKEDARQFVVDVEHFGQNRIRVVGIRRGPPLFPETVLEYLAPVGWKAERTDHEVIEGVKYPVIEFVRGDEIESMARRRQEEFTTLNL